MRVWLEPLESLATNGNQSGILQGELAVAHHLSFLDTGEETGTEPELPGFVCIYRG